MGPELRRQIARAGAGGRIAAYQVYDWITPLPPDALLAPRDDGRRAHRLRRGHRPVDDAGYPGDVEVEIFNQAIWDADPAEVAARTVRSFAAHVVA